ncbi:bzip transcription factor [Grosmannia clavigera kw1407]|uniref:Bzip transcription factor n=1 Tax=Grosmannia clavigera (strain kw1407 / UAMH 11150) TaxID=655863 RepID=F0XB04_GROCL|nr:bzip transcription factor [Grosmannia clavigera kw1407]EFX05160.1 bzip transcription factor [Grosmannia clavigera kw1407]
MSVKLEASPAESFLSAPGEVYSSLFSQASASPSAPATPHSLDGADVSVIDEDEHREKSVSFDLDDAGVTKTEDSPVTEKKTKKRKSWGQVLPEPKTNLPPRKRAKTEDEKEQRRVERVLRNRRAAQSSRERKRLEVEALEERNKELEALLLNAQKENLMLYQRLTQAEGKSVVMTSSRSTPVTLSQELFSSQDGHASLLGGGFMSPQDANTIDPVSLSPPLNPVRDTTDNDGHGATEQQPVPLSLPQPIHQQQLLQDLAQPAADVAALASSLLGPSPDKTQRPAATLCPDLQCLSAEVSPGWTMPQPLTLAHTALLCQLMLTSLSTMTLLAFRHPLTLIALSLKQGFSIPPTRAVLNSIIWLTTRPYRHSSAQASTSTTSSMRTGRSSHPATTSSSAAAALSRPSRLSSTLRLKVLRKILTSNPMLARPLVDATMRVLRLVCSEKPLDVVRVGGEAGAAGMRLAQLSADGAADGAWPWPGGRATLPSKEALITLLWTLRVYEKRGVRTSLGASTTTTTTIGQVKECWSKQPLTKGLPGWKRRRDVRGESRALGGDKHRRLN